MGLIENQTRAEVIDLLQKVVDAVKGDPEVDIKAKIEVVRHVPYGVSNFNPFIRNGMEVASWTVYHFDTSLLPRG